MVEVRFESATVAHAEQLAPLMRRADAAEVLAAGGVQPLEALLRSLRASEFSYAMLFDGEVAAMFGVAPYEINSALGPMGVGIAWALTGRAVTKHPKAFLKWSRPVLAVLREHCSVLVNRVDARYVGALRWLERIGFTIAPPEPYGPLGLAFCFVSIGRP